MYNIEWTRGALEELEKLESHISNRIIKKVDDLTEDPYKRDIKRLKGISGFRLRIGDYRVIFEIEKETIILLKVGHRKHIYD